MCSASPWKEKPKTWTCLLACHILTDPGQKVTSESEIHELGAIGHQDSEDRFDEEDIPRKGIEHEIARLRCAYRFVTEPLNGDTIEV